MDASIPNAVFATLLVVARLTPLAVLLPKVFSSSASWRWSVGLTVICALTIGPYCSLSLASTSIAPDVQGYDVLMAALRELVLGLAVALGFAVLLAGLFLAGSLLSQLAGIQLPDVTDPQGRAFGDSAMQRYLTWLSLAVLLMSGGHRQLISAVLDSLNWIPLGAPLPTIQPVPLAGQLLAYSFQSGLRIAAPIAFCLMVTTALVCVLARTMPSLGAFGLSVSVNVIVLLLVTCLSLESLATAYQQTWSSGIDQLIAPWAIDGGVGHD